MSGDNLLSHLTVKLYSEEKTETKKVFFLERKFQELEELREDLPEAAYFRIFSKK